VSFTQSNFGSRVIAHAKEKGTARLALKALALTPFTGKGDPARAAHPKSWYRPIDDRDLARKALRFTLSEDITAAIPPGDEKVYSLALELAAEFKPLSAAEREDVIAAARGVKPLFPIA
jgi:hypothetical protein